jgi:type IV secretory pathway VirB9-like protein
MKKLFLSMLLAGASITGVTAFAADSVPSASMKIDDPRSVRVGERAVVTVNLCQLMSTMLVLPEKELTRVTQVADTDNWVLETNQSKQASRFLSIKVRKPLVPQTTLNVITDHDSTYTFRLFLNDSHCDSKVFIDPDEQLAKHIADTRPWASPEQVDDLKHQVEAANNKANAAAGSVAAKVDEFKSSYPRKLNFEYMFDQKIAEKMGIKSIFNDGQFTYVSSVSHDTPSLFELKGGKPDPIHFDFRDGLYTADTVIDDGYLAIGGTGNGKHQERLNFHRVPAEAVN